VDLFEHQAHELFDKYGVPVGRYHVVSTAEEARGAAEEIGGPVVVKAQVKTGGRGKAGGVRLASDPADAARTAADILGMDIKGHPVGRVLIAEASTIVDEYYVALLLDRSNRSFLAMASRQGGVEIEQVAAENPAALARIPVNPIRGMDHETAFALCAQAKLPDHVRDKVSDILVKLWDVFQQEDATLVEINPLAELADGTVRALDGKITVDDNAEFRQQGHAAFLDTAAVRLEARAKERGLNYVKLDGEIGIIGNGAGLVMSTLDVVAYAGEALTNEPGRGVKAANFLDIGGGASATVMADGLEIILGDPAVKSVLVNVFGGITACDAVANGIVQALQLLETVDKPLVVRLDGNNAAEGRRILGEAALPAVHNVETMDGAAFLAAELAGKGA